MPKSARSTLRHFRSAVGELRHHPGECRDHLDSCWMITFKMDSGLRRNDDKDSTAPFVEENADSR
jgi:hypothetical protein